MGQTRAAATLLKGHALCVERPHIPEVRDPHSGIIFKVAELFGNDPLLAQQLRMKNAEAKLKGTSLYVCPVCGASLNVLVNIHGDKYYFKHVAGGEECALRQRSLPPDVLKAIIFNGARESEAHKQMKKMLAESLECDLSFSNIKEEAIIKDVSGTGRRRPDVSAYYGNTLFAFEVQLSNTLLNEIAGRRLSYAENSGFLFWVFKDFDLELAQMSKLDIFHINNCNAFVLDEETLKLSKENGELYLRCIWPEPVLEGCEVRFLRGEKAVKFMDITLDYKKQSAYCYDFARKIEEVESKLQEARFFTEFTEGVTVDDKVKVSSKYLMLTKQEKFKVEKLIGALESAVCGKPVGSNQSSLVSVFNQLYQYTPDLSVICLVAMKVYSGKLEGNAKSEEKKKKLEDKKRNVCSSVKMKKDEYLVSERFFPLLQVCYPRAYEEYINIINKV